MIWVEEVTRSRDHLSVPVDVAVAAVPSEHPQAPEHQRRIVTDWLSQ